MIIKVTTELLIFAEEEANSKKKNFCQQFQDILAKKFDLMTNFLKILPLLLTNAIFNMGTLVLSFSMLDLRISVSCFVAAFLLHFLFLNLFPFLLTTRLGRRLFRIGSDVGHKDLRQDFLTNLVLSWTNLFILSCSLRKGKFELATTVFALQVVSTGPDIFLSLFIRC